MAIIELKCHVGVGPTVTGEALVTDDNFSARYDLDRIAGAGVIASATAKAGHHTIATRDPDREAVEHHPR